MSESVINPWEMGEEVNVTIIPSFVKGNFMLIRLVPPKGKTIRDGLVSTLAMLSYESDNGTVKMVEVTESPEGYKVTFPRGKRGIFATKYRGPKSWYRFYNSATGKSYQVGKNDPISGINGMLEINYVKDYLSKSTPDWSKLSQVEKDEQIDTYYEDMYMFGLAKDFNLDIEINKGNVPFVGMVTDFYRKSTPPKEGKKYQNILTTKYASREGKPTLDGEYTQVDEEIAAAIYEALTRKEDTSFDPESFSDSDDISEGKLAA